MTTIICSSSRKLHFSRTRSDRHLDPGEMMGAYPTCIRHIRILLSYKCILQMLNASSRHSSPALLRGYSDEFNYSRNAPSACSGALILTSSNLLFGQGELQKQFSFTTMTLLCSQNEFSIWSILFSRTWISLFVKSWQFQNLPSKIITMDRGHYSVVT